MLSSRKRLAERQGQSGTPRHEYLQQLVTAYPGAQWLRKEEIVANLGNFAYDPINYAALKRLRVMELFVDIVVAYGDSARLVEAGNIEGARDGSTSGGERKRGDGETSSIVKSKRLLVEFALGGICNCVPDPALQGAFVEHGGVNAVSPFVFAMTLERFDDTLTEQPGTASCAAEGHAGLMAKSEFNTVLSALTIWYFLLDSPAFLDVTSESALAHVSTLVRHGNVQIANVAKAFLSRYEELLASASAHM